MVPGRRYRRSTSVAVRRTCGAESELEEGKISRGQRVQTQNTKKKPLSTHKFESRRAQVRQPKSKLHRRNDRCTHQRMQWSDTRSILHVHAVLPRHLLGCLKAFLLGWRTVLLSTSMIRCQVTRQRSWQATRTCSAEEEEGHRKRAYGKDSVKRRQLWRSLRRFWQLLQPGAFFSWKQCTFNYCLKS